MMIFPVISDGCTQVGNDPLVGVFLIVALAIIVLVIVVGSFWCDTK